MKTAKIILGEEEREIKELRARKLSAWLKQLEEPTVEAVNLVSEAMATDIDNPGAVEELLRQVATLLGGSMDRVLDLMIDYAPYLEEDIEEAYTSEIVPAFVEMLKLAIPFDLASLEEGEIRGFLEQAGELRASGSSDRSTGTS